MAKPDFKGLLSRKPSDFKKPPVLPAGTYFGILKSRTFDESSQKKTPFVRFMVGLTHPGEDIEPEQLMHEDKPIDISKKQMRLDFYLTDDATWRLTDFATSLGLDAESYQSTAEMIEDMLNQPVQVNIIAKPNQSGDELFNEIAKATGTANS